MVADHEIFHRPFATGAVESEFVDTPKHYADYPDGELLGPQTRVWRVHADPLKVKDYGLVSDGYGFADSPDCEKISGGINSKGPGSVAIGRQGNMLLWGFCAPPAEMTESAKKAFLNAVVYMKRFDGAPILVKDPVRAREWALVIAKYAADPKSRAFAERSFAPELLKEAEGDATKLRTLLLEQFEKIRCDIVEVKEKGPDGAETSYKTPRFSIDADVREIANSNRDRQLIDTCLNLIAHRTEVELSHRVLVRYLGVDFGPDLNHWTSWWAKNKENLVFSDTAGYRFVFKTAPMSASKPEGGD